jgi:hypothetical protein
LLGQDLQSSDSLAGPWIDLAQSLGSATFSIVTPGAAVTERIIGDAHTTTVTGRSLPLNKPALGFIKED